MMRNSTFLVLLFCINLLALSGLSAQQMWPGDIDDNGQVGAADLLYFGHAFGTEGNERFDIADLSWAPLQMGQMWEDTFPSGINYAYVDVSGNGLIENKDFQAIENFAGRTHGEWQEDMLLSPDTSSLLNRLTINSVSYEIRPAGTYLVTEVLLHAPEDIPYVENFYGLGLRVRFVPGTLRDANISVNALPNSWANAEGEVAYTLGFLDSLSGTIEVAFTKRDQQNSSGRGALFTIDLPVTEGIDINDLAAIGLQVEAAVIVDADMNASPIYVAPSSITVSNNCPFTVSPVTGIDGVVYLNSCFAEAAGITFYTPGAGYGPGINVASMDSTTVCGTDYDPVCGFNQYTYGNACIAESYGIQVYGSGVCPENDLSCYDPNLIVISAATTVNSFSGVITVDCPAAGEAVQGCDGNLYPNACLAEASGVRSYTLVGNGNDDCIDPDAFDPDANCGDEQAFVCGCNGYTFINACYAESAGVTSYTNGPCGGTSALCDEAISISCGDYLPNETTIGAGNQITSYPGCSSSAMLGPDRVYVVQKTGAGDLQIGLEIMTPGLDMDIFLLSGDCNNYTCLAASTTSNTITNNEGIILEDAPIGTYYIVVDQQQAGIGGNFRLEVSCGYLDCGNSVPLNCGTTYNGTNLNGNDDVSLYTCGNTLNVENNGPEIVHTFSISEAGPVTINLTGLSDNLELFLLSSCDRGSCLQFSQNPGNSSEQITRNLPAGTYYVVVDGYNGAISDYSLTVNCDETCGLTLLPTGTTDADCGQNNGVYNFSVYGGHPTYIATYTGPVSGTAVSNSGHFCFINLPAGTYTYTVQDANGCVTTSTFVIGDQGDLALVLNPFSAGCGTSGAIGVTVGGSLPPFTVVLSGPVTTVQTVYNQSFTINDLPAGTYTVTATNSSGCSASNTTTITQGNGNLDFVATPYPEGCGNPGRIHINVTNGQPNFLVQLSGHLNGTAEVDTDDFNVINLPAGIYYVTITDASGCSSSQTVVVPSGELDVQVSATPVSCGTTGSAVVAINSGTPPYTVNYFGPTSGTVTTSSNSININDLVSGLYTFSVWDNNGCDVTESVYVGSSGSDLDLVVSQANGDCSGSSAPVTFNISGGTPAYSMTYTGPTSGTVVINGSGLGSLELPAGNYTFIVSDFGGCSTVENFTVVPPQTGLDITASVSSNGCGQLQNITTNINGGDAPFSVTIANSCGLPVESFITFNTQFTMSSMDNCLYTITVTDANGCSGTDQVTVNDSGDTDLLTLIAGDGACGGVGFIDIIVSGGDDPYYISWTGPVSGDVALISPTYRIEDLPAGVYTVSIITNDGCTDEEIITLNNNGGSIDLASTLVYTDCGQYDQIWNDIIGGTPPFVVEVTRICDGVITTMTTMDDGFELTELIPCDYKIKVTDANGCMIMNTVTVFPYQLFDAIPTDGLCGQDGEIQINIMNNASQPPYQVTFTGPQSASFPTSSLEFSLSNLMAGTYTITIADANGCEETEIVTLEDNPSDLDLVTATISNDCGQYDQLWNDINGGVPPFTIEVTRLCTGTIDTTFVTNDNSFELLDLEECDYKVKVTDANGCMDMETRTIDPSPVDIFTATPVSGPCGQLGRIDVSFNGGTPPYQFLYSGPQSGSMLVNVSSLSLSDLPAGTYTLMVTDANGCSQLETVVVEVTNSDIVINSALIQNDCGQYNQVWNDIIGGTPPFSIEVLRLCDSTLFSDFIINDDQFELFDLPPCDYKIIVMDAAGCMTMDTVTVFPSPTDLFELDPMNGECNELGSFTVNFINGSPLYTVEYNGPVSGLETMLDSVPFTVTDLPSGTYTIIVTDSEGCQETEQTTITNTETDLELVTAVILNDCGQYNQLWNDINGGISPYTVEVIRLCDNVVDTTFVTNNNAFELPNLPPCNYKVIVTDAAGCMDMTTSNISSTNANLAEFTINNDCSNPSVFIDFIDGSAPYSVMLMSGGVQQEFTDITAPTFTVNQLIEGDYMIIVTSAEGCAEVDFIAISGGGVDDTPTANFTFETSGTSGVFTNTSTNGTTYLWDFDDEGATSNEENPEYSFGLPGDYNVCLTATNDCGSNQLCQTVTITVGSISLNIGNVSGQPNAIVNVPVTINGAPNLASLAGSLQLSDPAFGEILGVSPVLIEPTFNGDYSFSFFSNNAGGQPLIMGLENLLFYVQVRIMATSGQTMLEFSDSPLAMEVSVVDDFGVPQVTVPSMGMGQLTIAVAEIVPFDAAAFTYEDEPINSVTYELAPADGDFVTTVDGDANGYAHLGMQQTNEMYYLSASKTDDMELNGLSTFALYVAQRYLLGLPSPLITSPYQIIAADVNCNGSFSTLDLFLMQNMILGQSYEIPNCPEWLFIHESTEMPADWNLTNIFDYEEVGAIQLMSDTMTSFVGVRKGDILGNADASQLVGDDDGRSLTPFVMTAEVPMISAGETFNLELTSTQLSELVSLQFTYTFDASQWEYLGFDENHSLDGMAVNAALSERGQLNLGWFPMNGQPLAQEIGNVISLRFRALRDIDPSSLTSEVARSASGLKAMAHTASYERMLPTIELVSPANTAVTTTTNGIFSVAQNQPNPLSDLTAIRVNLPENGLLVLTITDAQGRQVLSRKQEYNAGQQLLNLDLGHLSSGLYYYQVRFGEHFASLPMLIQR